MYSYSNLMFVCRTESLSLHMYHTYCPDDSGSERRRVCKTLLRTANDPIIRQPPHRRNLPCKGVEASAGNPLFNTARLRIIPVQKMPRGTHGPSCVHMIQCFVHGLLCVVGHVLSRARLLCHFFSQASPPASPTTTPPSKARASPPGDPGRRRPPPGAPPGRAPPVIAPPSARPAPPSVEDVALLTSKEEEVCSVYFLPSFLPCRLGVEYDTVERACLDHECNPVLTVGLRLARVFTAVAINLSLPARGEADVPRTHHTVGCLSTAALWLTWKSWKHWVGFT